MDRQTLGSYTLLEEIGSGGMGTVYLGRQRETGEFAAVKVLPANLAREEGFVMRFTREAEALRSLISPHVVRLLDSGVEDDTYYFAMEYVDGENLAELLKREHRLSWMQAFDIATQLCLALKAAHDAGIVHRDLKPSNVLLSKTGQVKLTDFGVAQLFATERLTITGGVIGTAEYMSPEQAQGQRATKRSDLYSLGAILYVMLTGRPPFTGGTAMDVMHKQRYGQFDKPSRYVPELPPAVDVIIDDLMKKSPDERPPDAFVVSRRLQDIVRTGQLTSSDHPTPSETAFAKSTPHAGPGAATFMRDLVRAEVIRSAEPSWFEGIMNNTFVLLGMLVGLIVFVFWMAFAPGTPERNIAEATRILNEPAGPEWIRARDDLLEPLISEPAMSRLSLEERSELHAKIEPLLLEINVYELEQSLITPRRRERRGPSLREPVRQLMEIRRLWMEGHLAEAETRLSALVTITKVTGASDTELALAQRWQEQIAEDRVQGDAERRKYVRELLEVAQSNPSYTSPMIRAMLILYGQDSAVAEELAEAQRTLDQFSNRPDDP